MPVSRRIYQRPKVLTHRLVPGRWYEFLVWRAAAPPTPRAIPALNVVAFVNHWDPYPFILLNFILSFQAACTAPVIMMSQNRQSEIDRRHAEHDDRVNVKAELEIELLHHKIDMLREQEIAKLVSIIERLSQYLAPEVVAAIRDEGSAAPPVVA